MLTKIPIFIPINPTFIRFGHSLKHARCSPLSQFIIDFIPSNEATQAMKALDSRRVNLQTNRLILFIYQAVDFD